MSHRYNQLFFVMIAEDYDDLHQKINKKFIRNVIKPMRYAERHQDTAADAIPYQIPSASELFGNQDIPRGGSLPASRPMHPREPPPQREDWAPFHAENYASPPPPPPPRRFLRATPVMAPPPMETQTPGPQPLPVMNCVAICGHVQSCPVCSQLYRPYTGIYLAVIVILIIVILFLLKKIFQF